MKMFDVKQIIFSAYIKIIYSDSNNTECNNSSSDSGIESENEDYFFPVIQIQNCYA